MLIINSIAFCALIGAGLVQLKLLGEYLEINKLKGSLISAFIVLGHFAIAGYFLSCIIKSL